jgi:HEAT repeat protein/beta-lactamase regulating signal transducer with metallopeptidase domain
MSMTLLLDAAIKGTIYLAFLFALAGLLRRASASLRHLLWSVGLIGLLVLPALSLALPWRIAILPAADAVEVAAVDESAPQLRAAEASSQPLRAEKTEAGYALSAPREERAGPGLAVARPTSAESPAALVALGRLAHLPKALAILWLAGMLLVVGRLVAGTVAVWMITRRGRRLDEASWQRLLNRAAMRLGLVTPVRLLVSRHAPVPFGTGIFNPVVVLPDSAQGWSAERRFAVLLHECAHFRRSDAISQLIGELACAVFWFQPLVWLAARRLRAESERACDDLVLRAGTRPSEYVGHLIEIVRGAGRSWALAVAQPMARRSEFEGRLLAILEPGIKRHGLTPAAGLGVALAVVLTAVPLAAMGPERAASSDDGAKLSVPDETAQVDGAVHVTGDPEEITITVAQPERPAESSAGVPAEPRNRDVEERSQDPGVAQRVDRPDPVAALALALGDEDAGVRKTVVAALASLQDTAAVQALMQALREDSDPEVREAAAWALGEIEDARAVPALGEALQRDEVPAVRLMAAYALGEIEDPRGVEPLGAAIGDSDPKVRLAVIRALGEIESPDAIEPLSSALRDSDPEIREYAVWALGEIEDARAVPALADVLASDSEVAVRRKAAWALGEIEHGSAVDALAAALGDEDAEVRRVAIWALGEIEDPRAVEPLAGLLRDPDVEVRQQVARALGEIEDSRAVDPLLEALRDSDARVRELVAWALGEIEDPRAGPGLAAALADAEPAVRRTAIWALGEIELQSAPAALIEALRDEDMRVRRLAVRALAEIEDPAAVPGLAEFFRAADADAETRRLVIRALAEIHDPAAYQLLVEALNDEDPEIRRAAARALGRRE